ncbi:SPFH domain-containing protein [Cellulomonas massiliensis]|uniref:SPFH domain-containing protein n=1 Tax=Cellulomonas massiliensis TaxID=1465811 RepID=UPI00030C749B|nr:SPFH domain-containing protein [Cellulomonas massiliensis]
MAVVVREWERVLTYRDGLFERELGPGRHRVRRWRRTFARVVVRPRVVVLPLQEVLTGDGLSVKVSLTAMVRVDDPRAWHERVDEPDDLLHTALQLALREQVAGRTLDELLAARADVAEGARTATAALVAEVGLVVERVSLRDVVVPVELRRAAADVAAARAEGLAALERARSEVAATRALANAARLVEGQPGLLQLRTLQAIEAGGATVVLTTAGQPAAAGPVVRG